MPLRPAAPAVAKAAGTPSPEVTGPICRVPSPGVTRHALGFSPRAPVSVLGTVRRAPISRPPFQGLRGSGEPPIGAAIPALGPVLAITALPGPRAVRRGGGPAPPTSKRQGPGLPCGERYPAGAGILTGFPFGPSWLRGALGPAYPRLTTHCRGTLAPAAEGISTPLCCYYRRDLHSRPVHRTSRPGFCPTATPPYRIAATSAAPPGIGGQLSPVHFRGPQPRRVSCYALFKGWLLLSLPPRCLRSGMPFGLTLSWHLGALTSVWVAPLSV